MTATFRKHLLKAFMLTSFLSTSHMTYAMESAVAGEDGSPIEASTVSSRFKQTLDPYIATLEQGTDDPKKYKAAFKEMRKFLLNNPILDADNNTDNWEAIIKAIVYLENLTAYDAEGFFDYQHRTENPHFTRDYLEKLSLTMSLDSIEEAVKDSLSLLASATFLVQELINDTEVIRDQSSCMAILRRKLSVYPLRDNPDDASPDWFKANMLKLSLGGKILGLSFEDIFVMYSKVAGARPFYTAIQQQKLLESQKKQPKFTIKTTPQQEISTYHYPTASDGECGWYVLGTTYNDVLSMVLQTVDSMHIYDEIHYKTLLSRIRAVEGDSFFERLIAREGFRSIHDADDLETLRKNITRKTQPYSQALDVHGSAPERPADLQIETDDEEAKAAWAISIQDWERNTDTWQKEKDRLLKLREDATWSEQFDFIKDFRLPEEEIKDFIRSDFPRRYIDKFIEFGISEGGETADWFDIGQHILNVNIFVYVESSNSILRNITPINVTADGKLSLIKQRVIGNNAQNVAMLLTGTLPGAGHYSRLLLSSRMLPDGQENSNVAQVAKALRHIKLHN